MPPARGILLVLGAALLLLTSSCAPRRLAGRGPAGAEHPAVGVYRGQVFDAESRSRRFRLLLYARMPDRLHAEVVSPIGRTELILDGGEGRLSVAVVRERLAFVGDAGAALNEIVGAPVSLSSFVPALLTGEEGSGSYRVSRSGGRTPGLPERFELESGGRGIRLELKRLDRLDAAPADLGTGAVPAGFGVRELADLDWDWFAEEAVRATEP